jgi:hypothetical protein
MGSSGYAKAAMWLRRAPRASRRQPSSLAEPRRSLGAFASLRRMRPGSLDTLRGPDEPSADHGSRQSAITLKSSSIRCPAPNVGDTRSNRRPPLPPEGCFMIAGPASDPRRSHSVTLLSRSHSEEYDDSRGIGLATEPSSSTFPQPISALRRTLHPASGRLPNPGELVGAPRLGVGVPKNASTKLGDTSDLTFAWRGYPARRSGTAHRRTTLPGFYPLRRFWYGKRPTSGLPHPTVLRLQAFSTS